MKVSIKGVRGSIPTTDNDKAVYGGHTSCAVVMEDGWYLILDGGSGLQKVTIPDTATKRVDILLTHLHFDHIQGLGFFGALYNPSMEVHIWGPVSAVQSLHSRLSRYLSPPLFPVLIRELPCQLTLHDIENSTFEIGPFTIMSRYVIHPGPTVGFRIKGRHSIITYIPDHEPALGLKGMPVEEKWISGFDLAENADLLLHDGQFSAREYETKFGWGHSNIEDAIKLASLAKVKHLLLTHHDPFHSDSQLNEILSEVKDKIGNSFYYELAREGMEFDLP